MKVLWFIRRLTALPQFDSEFVRAFEKVIGKDNVVFYGLSNLPSVDPSGNRYFPESYKFIDRAKTVTGYPSNMTLSEIIKEENPDIIVLNDKPISTDLTKEINIPRILFLEDAHSEWNQSCVPYLDRKEIDMIFTRSYGNGQASRVKQRCPVGYSPFSVSPSMYYDKHSEKIYDVYLTGTCPHVYPLRILMGFTFYGTQNFGASQFNYEGMKGITDVRIFSLSKYLDTINQSKIVTFDGGLFKYPVIKYFETMACNILPLVDLPYDYKALRFEPNENVVEIDFFNFVSKMKYYLENESERKRISKNAMDLILEYHTTEKRAKQLLDQFEEVIKAKNEGRVFDYRNVKGEAGRQLTILEETVNNFNKDNLFNRCLDVGLRPPYYEWHKRASHIWSDIVTHQSSTQKWIDFIKETQ